MIIIPAIDIKDGQCVRLRQGAMDDVTVFNVDPVDAATRWVEQGAKRLHLVDLDGAVSGNTVNLDIVTAICKKYPLLVIQIGGGIRTLDNIAKYLAAGVSYVILGTKAVTEPQFLQQAATRYPDKIILGLDAKDGYVSIDGWQTTSQHTALDFIQQHNELPLAAIIYTDINRDGMMKGANLEATAELAQVANVGVIASGGVTSLDDVHKLGDYAKDGVIGAVVGRALYEGTLSLSQVKEFL